MKKQVTTFPFGLRKASEACAIAHCHPRQTHFPQPWRKQRLDIFYTTYVTSHTRHTYTPPWPRAKTAGFPWSAFPCSPSPPLHPSLSLCLSVALPIRIQCSNRSSKRWQKTGFPRIYTAGYRWLEREKMPLSFVIGRKAPRVQNWILMRSYSVPEPRGDIRQEFGKWMRA